ncbi:MAG: hypothetical protein ACSLFN_09000 [Candidatus Limnocylindrales bacterium]
MTLREVLEDAAALAGDDGPVAVVVDATGATAWSSRGTDFATLDAAGSTVAFRLDAVLAGAALRTPDVGASSRSADWVEFRPITLDGHAIDRATAWFLAALRRAG